MTEPRLNLALEDHSRVYHPGDVLAGKFSLQDVDGAELRSIELSVLWHTDGKGDEDMSVHFFERVEISGSEPVDVRQPRRFSTVLPNSPLSYSGFLVKVCWCVRARVFLARGKELTLEVPFQLGTVPRPQQVAV